MSNYIPAAGQVKGEGLDEQENGVLLAGDQEQSIAYKLRLAQIMAYQSFEERVTGFGAAPRYLGLLCVIAANPGQPQTRLARTIALQRSSLVTILDRQESEGLVERRNSETDRRAKSVWLTDKGRETVKALSQDAARHEQMLTENLTENERLTVLGGLETIIATLRKGLLGP